MNKHRIRRNLVRVLLAFVIFLYIFSIAVFLFGDPEDAIYVFAYTTFFTIIVYFLGILQRRFENMAKMREEEERESETEVDSKNPTSSDDSDGQ